MTKLKNNLPDPNQLRAELDEVYNEFSIKLDELKVRARLILDGIDKRLQDKNVQAVLDKIKNIE